MMNIEEVRYYCLDRPLATEDFPFDDTTLVFRVMGKIFAMVALDNTDWFVVKCDPAYAIELRDRYQGIAPAFHMNKKYWNQITLKDSDVPDKLICDLIAHSYHEVLKKFTRKMRQEYENKLKTEN